MVNVPSVAVVILNYNGKNWLEQFLPQVLTTDYPGVEVIIADNASTDDSISWLSHTYPAIRLIQLSQNLGYAGGYNRALEQVVANYFVLLNSDVSVQPGWLGPLINCMESNPNIGAAQPKIRSFHSPDFFEYAGAAGGWLDAWGYPFSRGRVMETIEPDKGQYNDNAPIFWATGAALCVRREAWVAAGGLDEVFFAHQEEIDFCWRLQLLGYQVVACGSSEVYHVGGGTLPVGSRKVYLNFRNNLLMLGKNLLPVEQFYTIPIRFALDGIAAWRALFSGRGGEFIAIARAHMFVLGWWIRDKNKPSKARKPIRSLVGVYKGMVLVDYFLRGKKLFSEIIRINP